MFYLFQDDCNIYMYIYIYVLSIYITVPRCLKLFLNGCLMEFAGGHDGRVENHILRDVSLWDGCPDRSHESNLSQVRCRRFNQWLER